MSRLLDIFDEMRELQGELMRLEAEVARHPQYAALELDLLSLQKRQRHLEAEFRTLADQQHIDVLNYKLIPAAGRVPVRALTATLDRFQAAVSTVFDSLRNGPKKIAKLTADIIELSSFDFAFTTSGSVGVVLSVPNERLLLGESQLDTAVNMVFQATQAQTREEIQEFSRRAGIASVRRLYQWSSAHVNYGINASIQWRRRDEIRSEVSIEAPQLRRLVEVIEETADSDESAVDVVCTLVGLDVDEKTFHLKAPEGEDIHGQWADSFTYSETFRFNYSYQAKLLKKSVTYYAYEKEETSWKLVSLQPLG